MLIGGRGRREMCAMCGNPVFLAERLLVGSPGQLMHRTCFRCARCTNQLTLASYYETEKGQFCCETCPDEEREKSDNISATQQPTDHQTTSDHESEDSDSDSDSNFDSDSDNFSASTDKVLEDTNKLKDTRLDTLESQTVSTEPKPRTVFLTQTLDSSSQGSEVKESNLDNNTSDLSSVTQKSSEFSQTSTVLFGKNVSESSQTSFSDTLVNNDAKGNKTLPPDNEQLDTGQDAKYSPNLQKAMSSSIVSSRLKLFDKTEDKNCSQTRLTNKTDDDNSNKEITTDDKNITDTSILTTELKNTADNEDDNQKVNLTADSNKNESFLHKNDICNDSVKKEKLHTEQAIQSQHSISNENLNEKIEPNDLVNPPKLI